MQPFNTATFLAMKTNYSLPSVVVALSYDVVYDDYDTIDVSSLIKGIPTVCILNFATALEGKTHYQFNYQPSQRNLIFNMCKYLDSNARRRVRKFMSNHSEVMLISTETLFYVCGLALQNYEPIDSTEKDFLLYEDEFEKVYKAILYFNKKWTDDQVRGNAMNIIDISLLVDIPIVEFKLYKDFRPQLYKAIQFFIFCSNDTHYKNILDLFCTDHNVNDWHEYLLNLFSFYEATLRGQYVRIDKNFPSDKVFFDQYIIDINDCHDLVDDHNALKYFRDHFLYPIKEGIYLPISPDLLVDKFYQAIKFDVFKTIQKHNIKRNNGKEYKSLPVFNSELGTNFSEPYLLYTLFEEIYKGRKDVVMFTGSELKKMNVPEEPDFYLRIGNCVFIFENKDILFPDMAKYSGEAKVIKETIIDKICKYPDASSKGVSREGFGQIHKSIENIIDNGLMDQIDPGIVNVKSVYPVLVSYDKAFSALGVNLTVIEEYQRILKEHPIKKPIFISIPTIMEFDSLLLCAYRLHTKEFDLRKLIMNYLISNQGNLQPFSTYVLDNPLKNASSSEEENKFLYGDLLKDITIP